MLLVANVGNENISFGFFESKECTLISSFKIACDLKKTSDEYLAVIGTISAAKGIGVENIEGAIISSVVPQLTNKIKDTLYAFSGQTPLIVGPGVKTGFLIKIDNPSELGGDMVANTAAAIRIKKAWKAAIIADIGAVCTVSAISKNGEYLGCSIFPGVQISLEALHGRTAQLPNVNASSTSRAIGKNSQEAICSGVLFGNAITLDGIVDRFISEIKCKTDEVQLFATGEYADVVLSKCKHSFDTDEYLTLKGLYYIYKNTIKE